MISNMLLQASGSTIPTSPAPPGQTETFDLTQDDASMISSWAEAAGGAEQAVEQLSGDGETEVTEAETNSEMFDHLWGAA